ncbi:thioredoxin domain-containing protein PLP3B-like isoform X2 [Prunus avium]|uniref:Thioredoxin domain-containing protein PLP3B-like isoform X2 n=1 Tax=Prunus avium TaxID=42229 RepID=A0A6P5TKE4_PRUAV|nr:thioredoxin domain-containing protein PLP3B-like isoform X2 [Prunus avium]
MDNAPFFVTKLGVKTLPCVIIFRLVGFQDMGGKDEFSTRALEVVIIKKGIIGEKKGEDDEDDGYHEGSRRTVRSSVNLDDSDSDWKKKEEE